MEKTESYSWHPIAPRMCAERPLMGISILLVEDSKYFSDAVRLMALRSGARLRRADCLQAALKHMRIYRPNAVLLDLGLPDGNGLSLLGSLAKQNTAPPIIAMSGDETAAQNALDQGACKFIAKPFFDLAVFQQTILSILPDGAQKFGFRPGIAGQVVHPDHNALCEDFARLRKIFQTALHTDCADKLRYGIQFLYSLALTVQDDKLKQIADELATNTPDKQHRDKIIPRLLRQLDSRLAT